MTLAPGGLGVAEILASVAALMVDIPPAVAFVAVALNRMLGLAASGVISLGERFFGKYFYPSS